MSRIATSLREPKGRRGFIPFVTAGDPDISTSLRILLKLADAGADVIELGVPFSDPMADGPTIQRSSQRALAKGVTLSAVLDLAREFRSMRDVPVVLFSYFNPIMQCGIANFATRAADAGVSGLLLTDVIEAEAVSISETLAAHEIDLISLVAPTTTDARLESICAAARGFIYAVSRAGVTGAREESSLTARDLVDRVRRYTDLPVAVGFGISTSEQIADVWEYADAAVVGSAIVAEIERSEDETDAVARVGELMKALLPKVANAGRET